MPSVKTITAVYDKIQELAAAFSAGPNNAFEASAVPAVTAGSYSAGDIVGGLIEFDVAGGNDSPVLIQSLQLACKAALTPVVRAIFFGADPSGTTKTDNAAYSLAAADVLKVRRTLSSSLHSVGWQSHGTPKTLVFPNLGLIMKPYPGGTKIGLLLVDDTGVTLTSTSDLQVTVAGLRAYG